MIQARQLISRMRTAMARILLLVAVGLVIAGAGTGAAQETRQQGRRFFATSVLPRLAENGCPMCHAVNYIRPNVTLYEELMPYLAMGDAPEKSAVIRKIANLGAFAPDRPTHPGGQRCKDLQSEPCKTIIQWWKLEFGSGS